MTILKIGFLLMTVLFVAIPGMLFQELVREAIVTRQIKNKNLDQDQTEGHQPPYQNIIYD